MPEWISHVIVAFFAAKLFRINKISVVLVGALLPDIYQKISYLLRYFFESDLLTAFYIPHTILGGILLSLIISPLFKIKFKKTISYLSLGVTTHFILDSLQGPVGYLFLWPFNSVAYSFRIIWIESYLPLVLSLSALTIYLLTKRKEIKH